MKIAIIGAGIGGLTLGVALRRDGHEVVLLEKRPHFGDEGAGVILGPNVMGALKRLSLHDEILDAGRVVQAMNITDERGNVLARSRYEVAGLPLPGVAIHRSALHELLRRNFQGELRLGQEITALEAGEPSRVVSNGERLSCDLLVGADGIRSRARERIAPNFATRYSGVTCFRFVVDGRFTDEVFEMWGPGKRVGVVPLGGERTYVFLTLNAAERAPKQFTTLDEFRALWAEFAGPAPEAFARLTSLDAVLHNDLEDGLAPKFWLPGLVLLGDAAHTVTPNMGQGAGLAIEDACCLAHLLSQRKPVNEALAEYEALRKPRASWILEQSFRLGRIAQVESAPVRWLRDLALRMTPASVNDRALRRIVTDMPGVPLQ